MSIEGKHGFVRNIGTRIIDALGEQLMKDPAIASAITDKARSTAAAEAYEKTEPTMQAIADVRMQINGELRKQQGGHS